MSSLAIWNGYMSSYDFLTNVDGYQRNIHELARALNAQAGQRVLDAGSGTGNLSILLKSKGVRVTSFDFSSSAQRKHKKKDPDADLVEGSLEEPLPFPDGHFDAVCCASVLFALSEEGCELSLSEFQRVLRPGGQLVLTVPAAEASLERLVVMYFQGLVMKHGALGYLRGLWGLPNLAKILYYNWKLKRLPDWEGCHCFTDRELRQRIQTAGFGGLSLGRTYGGVFFLVQASRPLSQARNSFDEARPLHASVPPLLLGGMA